MWTDEEKSEARSFFHHQESVNERLVRHALAMQQQREPVDLTFLLRSYALGECSHIDVFYFRLRELIDEIAHDSGFIEPQQTMFDHSGGLRRDILPLFCPDLISDLFDLRLNAGLAAITLLEPGANELVDEGLPPPMNMLLRQRTRPAMYAYMTDDAVLYVDRFRYQLLSRDRSALWMSGSPRALLRRALGDPEPISTNKNIVVLTDRFTGNNFSHFLFDGITRAVLLHAQLGSLRDHILVFNGIPHEFHEVTCASLAQVLGVDARDICFPSRPVVFETSGRCIWFSDQVDTYTHPAQMAHPLSVALLRTVTNAMPGEPSECKRLYVSRNDARTRRVTNDEQLRGALARLGFRAVELSGASVSQQIGLFRGVQIVVGAHGMGLTHIAAGDRLEGLVELFHPSAGTDAYAFITKARGADYQAVVGKSVGGDVCDFEIDVASVVTAVDEIERRRGGRQRGSSPASLTAAETSRAWLPELPGGAPDLSAFNANAAAIAAPSAPPQSKQRVLMDVSSPGWHPGCQLSAAVVVGDIAPPVAGVAVIKHVRDRVARVADTNVGWWVISDLRAGTTYTVSCMVYVPRSSGQAEVILHIGAPVGGSRLADPGRWDEWQRLSVTLVPPDDLAELPIVLRVVSDAETVIYSSAWSLEERPEDTVEAASPALPPASVGNGWSDALPPDMPASDLMMRFESLGENCEFGLVQRRCGAEPLGLFRFANAPLPPLVAALEARFEGLGQPERLDVTLLEEQEYIIHDRQFGFVYHSWVRVGEMTAEQIRQREIRRLPFLVRKLVEELTAGEKIFVYHGMTQLSEQQIGPLLAAVRRYGSNTLLWVSVADDAHPPGTVAWVAPGLLKGYIDRFAPGSDAYDLSLEGWMAICRAAYRLWREDAGEVQRASASPGVGLISGQSGRASLEALA